MDNDIIHSIKEIMENIQQNCERKWFDGEHESADSGKNTCKKIGKPGREGTT